MAILFHCRAGEWLNVKSKNPCRGKVKEKGGSLAMELW